MRSYLKYVPILALGLASCAKDIPEDKSIPIPLLSALSVLKTIPEDGATNVPLDTELSIILDQKVDAYSAIPQNFEIWNDDGSRVGAAKLVSTKFMEHPSIPDFIVSKITVSLRGTYLLPNSKYYFLWGASSSSQGEVDSNALGIQSLFGAPLNEGRISFTTGTEFQNFSRRNLDVLSMTPGRIFGRGDTFDFNASFGDLFSRSSENSYLTVRKKAEIRIHFSEPIVDRNSEYDLITNGFSELAPTPIDDFGNMTIITGSKDLKFNEIHNSVRDLNWDGWLAFRDSYSERLQGKVRTEDGRRTLIFELDTNCSPAYLCEYPEWPGSVVVVVLKDLKAWQTEKRLVDETAVGGFIHFPGFTLENFDFDFFNREESES